MSVNITVLCPFGLDAGLVSKAAELGAVRVLVPEQEAELAAIYGGEKIHTIAEFSCTDEAGFVLWLKEKLEVWGDSIVLAPATVQMRSIMPMLAWHMNAGLTADCTGLAVENGRLLQTRPAFGNSLMADIETLSPVQMATVRVGTFRPVKTLRNAEILMERLPGQGTAVKILEAAVQKAGVSLQEAEIIVAGGAGVGSKEGFAKLTKLAEKLGGTPAASRRAVDAGLAPYRLQVGMTGVTVSPKIYIAVGISGAVQHLAGMSGAETVIAINSDPKAPIFDYADYGVVADWESVADEILEER